MTNKIKIVGLGGSLSTHSTSLAALDIALQAAGKDGAETSLLNIRYLNLPMYDPEEKDIPDSVKHLVEEVKSAHGLILCSPLYHGTVSGSFKNAIDWLQILHTGQTPYLANKIVGLMCTAGGAQGLQAINTMDFIVRALKGWSVPMVMPVSHAWKLFDESGHIKDAHAELQIQALGKEVYRAVCDFIFQGDCAYKHTNPREFTELASSI
jgi:FMN reductase